MFACTSVGRLTLWLSRIPNGYAYRGNGKDDYVYNGIALPITPLKKRTWTPKNNKGNYHEQDRTFPLHL